MTDYCTVAELREYIHDTSSNDGTLLANAVTSASRWVDSYCDRQFSSAAGTYVFDASDYYCLPLCGQDLATTSGATVTLDTGYDGTYATTWTAGTHYVAMPQNGTSGGVPTPYRELRALGGNQWPERVPWRPGLVRVAGTFGWSAVPAPVKQATLVMGAYYYKAGDAALGVAGFGEFGAIRVRENPIAADLLAPYRRSPIAVA